MRDVVVDTNVVISFLTDRNPEQQARAAALFERASQGEVLLLLHQIVVSETVFVLKNIYEVPAKEIRMVINDLLALPGVLAIDDIRWSAVFEAWPDEFADFPDACLAAVARASYFDEIATFDRRFARDLRAGGISVSI